MIYITIVAGIFLAEFFGKSYIEKHKKEGKEEPVWGGRIVIRKYHNRGAFLNAGEWRSSVVAVLSFSLTVCVAVFFLRTGRQKGKYMMKTGLALLLGGALSNTYDRLKRKYVVDYFSFGVKWKRLRNIVFNISDFCILAGTLLTVLGQEETL